MSVKVSREVDPVRFNHPNAARYLDISRSKLDDLRDVGAIEGHVDPHIKQNKRQRLHWMYRKTDLDRYIETCRLKTDRMMKMPPKSKLPATHRKGKANAV